MNQVTLTLPLDNAEALLRGSDLLVGLAKDARMKEPLPQRLELREGLTTTEASLPPRPVAPKSKPEPEAPEFDTDGTPWDERIHSSNRKLTAQGVWQRRRNVSDELYDLVVAELKGGDQEQDEGLPVYTDELKSQIGSDEEDLANAKAELAAATPPTPTPPPPPVRLAEVCPSQEAHSTPQDVPDMTFAELIKEITERQINPDTVLEAVQSTGLENVGELFNRPDLIPQVARELGIES